MMHLPTANQHRSPSSSIYTPKFNLSITHRTYPCKQTNTPPEPSTTTAGSEKKRGGEGPTRRIAHLHFTLDVYLLDLYHKIESPSPSGSHPIPSYASAPKPGPRDFSPKSAVPICISSNCHHASPLEMCIFQLQTG